MKGDWLVRLPASMSAREAMAIGTAGYTAMLAVMALERHGLTPERGPIVVTGAAGGVGSVAIALLAKLGFSVIAVTGRPQEADYLKGLGAAEIIDRKDLSGPAKPLAKERWAGGIDAVGSTTLANVLSMTRYGGAVAACGLAGGMDLPTSVAPFILRGVSSLRHRFRDVPDRPPAGGLETPGNRTGPPKFGCNDQRNWPFRGSGSGGGHPGRPNSRPNRGQNRVNMFRIWRRTSGTVRKA